MFLPHFYHAFLLHFINKIKISLKINDLAIIIFLPHVKKRGNSGTGGTTKKRQHAVASFFVSLSFRLYDKNLHSLALWRGVGSETFISSSLLSAFLRHSACQSCDNLQQ